MMVVLVVSLDIKPEFAAAFEEISRYNHENAIKEPGCLRFDVLKNSAEDGKYTLYEAYRDSEAVDFHKSTVHYKKWAETITPMCAAPRTKIVCDAVAFTK